MMKTRSASLQSKSGGFACLFLVISAIFFVYVMRSGESSSPCLLLPPVIVSQPSCKACSSNSTDITLEDPTTAEVNNRVSHHRSSLDSSSATGSGLREPAARVCINPTGEPVNLVTTNHARIFSYPTEVVLDAQALITRQLLSEHIDLTPWENLFLESQRKNHPLVVFQFGGSTAAGSECFQGVVIEGVTKADPECAYPNRAAAALQKVFDTVIDFHNFAGGGISSRTMLTLLDPLFSQAAPLIPDLILCDFTANDASEQHMSLDFFDDCGAITEALLLALRRHAPNAAIMFVFSPFQIYRSDIDAIFIRIRTALDYHKIPVLDLRSVSKGSGWRVWSAKENRWVLHQYAQVMWKGKSTVATARYDGPHPAWEVHQAIAEMLVHGLYVMYERLCHPSGGHRALGDGDITYKSGSADDDVWLSRPLRYKRTASYARRPTTVLSALHPPVGGFLGFAMTPLGSWKLMEDVARKPGWITTTRNSTITFPVRLGPKDPFSIAITYLRSYTAIGDAYVTLNHSNETIAIIGRWDNPFSVPQIAQIGVGRKGLYHGEIGTFRNISVAANDTIFVTVQFKGPEGTKFKVISVAGF